MAYAVDNAEVEYPKEVDLQPRGDNIDWSLLEEKCRDQHWRLNNLYKIVDENGKVVPFKMNWAQEDLYRGLWYNNIVLKARQLGFSTFIEIFILDSCLWRENISAAVIAHGQKEASDLFQKKILFAYNNLPDIIRQWRPAAKLSKTEIQFNNGSSISVAVSARSGTHQILHISEFGKICTKYPAKADEIVSGSLEAVHQGNLVFIESTAEGHDGHFYDFTQRAQNLLWMGKRLTASDYKFHFYPWHQNPNYRASDEDTERTVIPQRLVEYFHRLEDEYGIELDANQKAWYAGKDLTLGSMVRREHPSYPAEAFEAKIEGAIYGEQIDRMRMEGRVTSVPINPNIPVDTWWDLGINDYMVIILTQTVGREIHLVDWYMNHGYGMEHYTKWLNTWLQDEAPIGTVFGHHIGPHDIEHHEIGTGQTRVEYAYENFGFHFEVSPMRGVQEGIDLVRRVFPYVYADEQRCGDLIDKLALYQREWDPNRGAFKDNPRHDEHSHPADALRTGITIHPFAARRELPSSPQSGKPRTR